MPCFIWQKRYHIIDAPAHRQCISEVPSKTVSAGFVILVVCAKEKLFDTACHREQLKELALLCKISGIDNIIVAVDKMNLLA